jgi:hypothetical protein
MTDLPDTPAARSEIVFYQTEEGEGRIQVRLEGNTVWLTQRLLAELYQVAVPTVNEHLANIFEEGELDPSATVRKFRIVQAEGKRQVTRAIDHYNLDVVLAVGYRIRSHRGTEFRRWATERLREYLVEGFVLDDERLKEGKGLGADYFDELLERIRDIRASEKRFYQKVRDIYALAIDVAGRAKGSQCDFAQRLLVLDHEDGLGSLRPRRDRHGRDGCRRGGRKLARQIDLERGPLAQLAVDPDVAAALLDDAVDRRR